MLGIGNEALKQKLKDIDKSVSDATADTKMSAADKVGVYATAISDLTAINQDLNQVEDHARLSKLRSVRNYLDSLEEFSTVNGKMEDNSAQLEKARQNVANVIWYFNNQEMSTRALGKTGSRTVQPLVRQCKRRMGHIQCQ